MHRPSRSSPRLLLATAALAVSSCGTAGPVPAERPAASGAPGGAAVTIVARDIAFIQAAVSVASGVPFTIVFENDDAVAHNPSIFTTGPGHERRLDGAVFSGPATRWYAAPALEPGTYDFVCDVHPNMTGRLVAS